MILPLMAIGSSDGAECFDELGGEDELCARAGVLDGGRLRVGLLLIILLCRTVILLMRWVICLCRLGMLLMGLLVVMIIGLLGCC